MICENTERYPEMTLQIEQELTSLLLAPGQAPEQTARELIVLELYRQRKISSGKAAQLLHSTKMVFLERAAALGIPYFNLTAEEFDDELAESRTLTV